MAGLAHGPSGDPGNPGDPAPSPGKRSAAVGGARFVVVVTADEPRIDGQIQGSSGTDVDVPGSMAPLPETRAWGQSAADPVRRSGQAFRGSTPAPVLTTHPHSTTRPRTCHEMRPLFSSERSLSSSGIRKTQRVQECRCASIISAAANPVDPPPGSIGRISLLPFPSDGLVYECHAPFRVHSSRDLSSSINCPLLLSRC